MLYTIYIRTAGSADSARLCRITGLGTRAMGKALKRLAVQVDAETLAQTLGPRATGLRVLPIRHHQPLAKLRRRD